VKNESPYPQFHVTLTDLDHNEVYAGTHTERGRNGHIMVDVSLQQRGDSNSKHLSRLLLHTWNTDYISGVTTWNNIEYGMCFKRT